MIHKVAGIAGFIRSEPGKFCLVHNGAKVLFKGDDYGEVATSETIECFDSHKNKLCCEKK